jgi:hypothetical protein
MVFWIVFLGRVVRFDVALIGDPIRIARRRGFIDRSARPGNGIAVQIVRQIVLPDQPGEFGERVGDLGPRRRTVARTRERIVAAIRTEIAVGHKVRPDSGGYAIQGPTQTAAYSNDAFRTAGLPHLVWRLDPEQPEPRREHTGDALYEHKPRLGHLSIILDNEA